MLTLNLARGSFHIIEGHNSGNVELLDAKLPVNRYRFSRAGHLEGLPPIREVHDALLAGGIAPDVVLAKLIEVYLPFRLFRVGRYRRMSLVIGLIGRKGAGKTCGAVGIAILDWMVRGLPCWSNTPIKFRVVYGDLEKTFESLPLDRRNFLDITAGYQGGVVLADEANMEFSEGKRAMSGANLAFDAQIQQVRKRHVSVLYTVQGWNWIGDRLRWQTDLAITCRDAALAGQGKARRPGEKSLWGVHDLSGITGSFDEEYEEKHRYLHDYKIWDGIFLSRCFWGAYETDLVLGQTDYIEDFRHKKSVDLEAKEYAIAEGRRLPARDFARTLWETGDEEYSALELWKVNGIQADRAGQTKLGIELGKYFERKRDGAGYFYRRRPVPLDDQRDGELPD